MLDYFKIKNFKSILDEVIDFTATKRLPNGYSEEESEEIYFLKNKKGKKYIPINAFWGANASGKTNIIKAIGVFKNIALGQANIKDNFFPNKLLDSQENTIFELKVNIDNQDYIYLIEYNNIEIIKEKLTFENSMLFEISKNRKDFKNIESKKESFFNEKYLSDFFDKTCINDGKQVSTFLSKSLKEFPSLNLKMVAFFNFLSKQLRVFLTNELPCGLAVDLLSNGNDDENLQRAFDRIVEVLKNLDLSISKMEFNREKIGLQENVNLLEYKNSDSLGIDIREKILKIDAMTSYHKNLSNKLIPFKFKQDESQGTQILFGLIGVILKAFDDGAILVIDELERSLHPLILISITKMFKNKYWNKNKTQLIFSTHNTDILDDCILRTTEVNIVEKTLKNGTKIANLDSFELGNGKKVRNVANFRKQYLSGIYGGIPFPMK